MIKEQHVLFAFFACLWVAFFWLWLVVPEGRDYTPGPNSGEVPTTAHDAVENALVMTSVALMACIVESWRDR